MYKPKYKIFAICVCCEKRFEQKHGLRKKCDECKIQEGKMKTLKINKRRFVEWFWSDEDSLVDLGNDVVEALIDEGTYTKTLSDAWNNVDTYIDLLF